MSARLACLAAAVAAVVTLAFPAAGSAARRPIEKLTYEVPVTRPDASGDPVTLETDVYLPERRAPKDGRPFVVLFHGGGSNKDNAFDSLHARGFARRGYVSMLYSARGHGGSGGETTIIGPKEVRDGYDVIAWALGDPAMSEPRHPDFEIDERRIGLSGYSQGGLHTNLLQVWNRDRNLNPYGIRFRALEPGNTPDRTFEALVQNGAVKLSYGAGLIKTYYVDAGGRVEPIVTKWIATAALDQPALYGGALCDERGHDAPGSTMRQDLAARSPGCFVERMKPPSFWAQAFDDELFTPQMAISMWRHMPAGRRQNRLYLDMAGHGAPAATEQQQRDKFRRQIAFFDHHLRGKPLRGARVVYWTRDPDVAVPADAYAYPDAAWYRQTDRRFPPRDTKKKAWELGADGRLVSAGATAGSMPLAPLASDESNDPVAHAALSATPLGTSPLPAGLPALTEPGTIAAFASEPLTRDRELAGSPRFELGWTPLSPESQVIVKLFDAAPDGRLTLLSRGVHGLRGVPPGEARRVTIESNAFSALLRRGHRMVVYVMAADAAFYKPYAGSLGGVLDVGPGANVTLPLRGR